MIEKLPIGGFSFFYATNFAITLTNFVKVCNRRENCDMDKSVQWDHVNKNRTAGYAERFLANMFFSQIATKQAETQEAGEKRCLRVTTAQMTASGRLTGS